MVFIYKDIQYMYEEECLGVARQIFPCVYA